MGKTRKPLSKKSSLPKKASSGLPSGGVMKAATSIIGGVMQSA